MLIPSTLYFSMKNVINYHFFPLKWRIHVVAPKMFKDVCLSSTNGRQFFKVWPALRKIMDNCDIGVGECVLIEH